MSIATRIIHRMEPKTDRVILVVSGEHKILEIKKHWAACVGPAIWLAIGDAMMIWADLMNLWVWWVIFALGLTIAIKSLWAIVGEFRDRFVITNQRIFRASGVIATDRASIPIGRILDITTKHTLLGRVLGYGHLIFESAAQVQGLNEITYVAKADEREQILLLAIKGDEMHELAKLEEDDGT